MNNPASVYHTILKAHGTRWRSKNLPELFPHTKSTTDNETLPLSPNGRRYGALESKSGPTKYGVAVLSPAKMIASAINLTEWCGPFRDQGDLRAYTPFVVPE